jgi:hypothetical protein
MQGESRENAAKPDLSVYFEVGFCVLEYRPEPWTTPAESAAPVFMLVLDGGKDLRLFLNPGWRDFVRAEDAEYIELFLSDVQMRARQLPQQLFDQLSSLSLGPLVTRTAGPDFSSLRGLDELYSGLEPL